MGYTPKILNKTAHQLYLGGILSYTNIEEDTKRYTHHRAYLFELGTYLGKYGDKTKWIPA